MTVNAAQACPCGSGKAYQDCCQPLHQGALASSPEALMRSRYAAFVLGLEDYLAQSWHPDTRPEGPYCNPGTRWLRLEVENSSADGDQGSVSFRACFSADGRFHQLAETSRFIKLDGHWRYLDGEAQWQTLQPGRNDNCPCGSGKKFKNAVADGC
ncbi:YchJ family protein [Oceanobacter mangrovi]|uniref:YchJ family protein n=1 Tax=Oceanobacter mangrovi TaxID=2862510 RepID=UPI001C8DDBEA|nr:YchJ family protein [Oceanobacter mangrovi]